VLAGGYPRIDEEGIFYSERVTDCFLNDNSRGV
jgi:hypothetical protein